MLGYNYNLLCMPEEPLEPAFADPPQAGQDGPQPRCVHTITDRFSMSNTYLIVGERLIVVDPGSELNVRQLWHYLQRFLHRSPTEIDLVVLTHLHTDHIAGIVTLRRLCSAPIAASAVVRELAGRSPDDLLTPVLNQVSFQRLPGILQHLDLFPPAYERLSKQIDLWLNDAEGLPGHPTWRVIASPGHTPESICLYNPGSRELLCGDTVTTVQGGAPLVRGGTNRQQLAETLKVLRSLHANYLYPGHGRPILGRHPLDNIEVEW
jgi:glyoxylase-like metal-dependent hydrolase (beta-lactamase superfamily II)